MGRALWCDRGSSISRNRMTLARNPAFSLSFAMPTMARGVAGRTRLMSVRTPRKTRTTERTVPRSGEIPSVRVRAAPNEVLDGSNPGCCLWNPWCSDRSRFQSRHPKALANHSGQPTVQCCNLPWTSLSGHLARRAAGIASAGDFACYTSSPSTAEHLGSGDAGGDAAGARREGH